MKKVIVYGLGSRMLHNISWIEEHYDVFGYSDREVKSEINGRKINFIKQENLHLVEFDLIIITSTYSKEIKDRLTNEYGLDEKNIVSDYEQFINTCEGNLYHLGELNRDKTVCIIRPNTEIFGLFGIFQIIIIRIREAIEKGWHPVVDLKEYKTIYHNDCNVGKINVWEYFFRQPQEIDLDQAMSSKNVVIIEGNNLVTNPQYTYGKVVFNQEVRKIYHDISQKYVKLNEATLNILDAHYEKVFTTKIRPKDKVLGVAYRGTDYQKNKPAFHSIQPSLEQEIEQVKKFMKEWKMEYIYISTEDEIAMEKFKQEFGDKILCFERNRYTLEENRNFIYEYQLPVENSEYIRGLEYLIDIELLSKCNAIIGGQAGGTLGSLIIKGKFDYEYIYDLGTW